ncbi:prominin-like protein isoform X2 [Phlebotomus argentipes]|uniref:prominin-like protein isoform X2 n=1 Tax=Phlebotomus argentipes TaxID=94469 RepID=UPI002892C615|nr:prominin-like protein isoform X2 [Phlebotomus argentipes]
MMAILYDFARLFFWVSLPMVVTGARGAYDGGRILDFKETSFSNWEQNVTYISSTGYHARGMAPMYQITNRVLDLFIGPDAIPEGYIIVSDRSVAFGPKVQNHEYGDLAKHYWAILLVVSVAALIIVLTPIVGFCFCCCRCAGACGGRSQPFDKKHDTCRRVFLGLFLICTGTGIVFGVVVAFVTNCYMQQGIENATVSAKEGVGDTRLFLKTTSGEINHLLVRNYNELSHHLHQMLNETATMTMTRLDEASNATSLTQLNNFVQTLPQVKRNLERLKELTNDLRANASQLNDGLRSVKGRLLNSLTSCDAAACRDVLTQYEIGTLDVNGIDYNQLPDVTDTIDNVNALITGKLMSSLANGQQAVEDVKKKINDVIGENIPKVSMAINEAGLAIKDISNEVTRAIDRISDLSGNYTYKYFDMADEYIREYSVYRYYAGLAISSVLLLILLCVCMGLLCGICGKRPDGYGDDCCNKGAGGRFLMMAVAVIFLTLSLLTLAALIQFLVGLVAHRGVCVSLKNPTDDQIFNYVDQLIDLNTVIYPSSSNNRGKSAKVRQYQRETAPFRISQVIEACHSNKAAYEVLQLRNFLDIAQVRGYPEKYNIDGLLDDLIRSVEVESNLVILNSDARAEIEKLAASELNNFPAHKFEQHLTDDITKINLTELAVKLDETAAKIPDTSNMNDIKMSLKNQALHLRTYQTSLVTPMMDGKNEILMLALDLDKTLHFNSASFEEAINKFLVETDKAQEFINKNGTEFVRQVISELTTGFRNEITTYLELVVKTTENDLGRCGPISNVYNATLVAACNRIIDPFNGFWAGVGWCVLIFIPTVILCVKLSGLYQKSDPYPGPLVESEYLYDAYSERDNIPLANGPKHKRRNKKYERRRNSRDPRDYYEDSNSPGGSRDNRYNDMAPNFYRSDGNNNAFSSPNSPSNIFYITAGQSPTAPEKTSPSAAGRFDRKQTPKSLRKLNRSQFF